ncbi:c-type cytochrome biogenesis protein CcmI, partial [Arenibaculum pallidiluteum]|uniref:c-type cytochrome biogenesis protein CcmI n=1 Tax=Arenibaculum pallidiluteum TaxID=2812559 RepID=UPI001A963040
MLFWILAAALTAAATAFVLRPLMRGPEASPGQATPDRSAYDLEVYRDQLKELDRDLARGVIGPAQAEAARAEIGRRMIAAAGTAERGGDPAPRAPRAAGAGGAGAAAGPAAP